jgi:hypothetical protein
MRTSWQWSSQLSPKECTSTNSTATRTKACSSQTGWKWCESPFCTCTMPSTEYVTNLHFRAVELQSAHPEPQKERIPTLRPERIPPKIERKPTICSSNPTFSQAQDYITNHLELNFNMKNFLSFFRIWNAVEYLKQPQFKFKASIKRVLYF